MTKTNSTNPNLRKLISTLRSRDKDIWKRVASELEKPRRRRRTVNLTKLGRYCNAGEIALVPGKLLADGELSMKLDVAALNSSAAAVKKIEAMGGKFYSIAKLLEKNPEAKGVRIIG